MRLIHQLLGLAQHYLEELTNLALGRFFDVSEFVLDVADELCLVPDTFISVMASPTIMVLRATQGPSPLASAYGLEVHFSFLTRSAHISTRYQPVVAINWLEQRILRQAFLDWLDMAVTSTSYALEGHL